MLSSLAQRASRSKKDCFQSLPLTKGRTTSSPSMMSSSICQIQGELLARWSTLVRTGCCQQHSQQQGILFRTSRLLATLGYPEPYERMWQKGLPSPHMAYFSPQNLKDLIERHSSLRRWPSGAKSLPAISAVGLKERIESHAVGVPTWVVYIPLFLLSKVARLFPSDIHLAIFTKDKTL